MARSRQQGLWLVGAWALIAGCDASIDPATDSGADVSEYAKGYALVHWQADKLRNIDKLLLVKFERDVINEITDEVADLSGQVADELEAFAATRDDIVLDREFLPLIEAEARRRMGLNIAGELLLSTGCNFEQRLLFTEAVAVLRMASLAEEMRDEAPDDEQEALWADIADRSNAVFSRVRDLIDRCEHE